VIQDRSFNADGSLFYPDTRAFFDGFSGPYIPDSDVSPIWNPEFFANTMVVNGRTWPVLEVEPRRYRFRLLNGCNSRFLILRLAENPTTRPATTALPFWVIGADGGFLPAAVQLRQVVLGPAERADVIVDFTGLAVGTELYLVNLGPDEPFGNVTEPPEPFANPDTTGQVMKLTVVPLTSQDPITENPALNSIEVWEIYNFTVDAHPIHIHEVQFQVVNRQPIDGAARPPEPSESGDKDTVIAYPGEITRVKALFDRAGLFVWHCHIVEHEDNEMMRPYFIGPNPPTASGT
jgi:FtsP/CotA-like multicopper oxidase with cupredoxin domain